MPVDICGHVTTTLYSTAAQVVHKSWLRSSNPGIYFPDFNQTNSPNYEKMGNNSINWDCSGITNDIFLPMAWQQNSVGSKMSLKLVASKDFGCSRVLPIKTK